MLLLAHVLGLTTLLWSSIFPLRYNMALSAVVSFQGERLSTRTVVQCRIIDGTKTLTARYNAKMLTDPPTFLLGDGSILVLSMEADQVCRWFNEPPKIGDSYRFDAGDQFRGRMIGKTAGIGGRALRFDNPTQPRELEVTSLRRLMQSNGSDLSLEALTMEATHDAPHHAVARVFPWARKVETVANPENSAEFRFFGVQARVQRLPPGGQCDGAPVPATDLTKLDPFARCSCPGSDTCMIDAGSLKPRFSSDFSRIEFSTGEIQPNLSMTLVLAKHLLDSKAPIAPAEGLDWRHYSFTWSPSVCIDGKCEPLRARMLFLDPTKRLVLQLGQVIYHGNGLPDRPISWAGWADE